MANTTGVMNIDRTIASTDAAAQASGFMLLADQSDNTGHEELNDQASGGQMQITTRAINGLMRVNFHTT